jgi:glyoxylase-like metal-dependent hydrolase (beta-lactamase superfamily II)
MRQFAGLTHPNGTLEDGLARVGVDVSAVDIVIDTHLHGDHAGGNTAFAEDGSVCPTFPNAEYFVHQMEYEDAMRPNERTRATYIPINYAPLVETGQMTLLKTDETEIAPGVTVIRTPGHTPGHMSVVISDGGQYLFFPCDLATYAAHLERLAWMTAYDIEPLVTMETKRHWQHWVIENNAIVVFPHDITMLAARLHRMDGERVRLAPLDPTEGAVYS